MDFISAFKTLVCYGLDLNYGTKKYTLPKVGLDIGNGLCKLGALYLLPGQVFISNTGCEILTRYLTDLIENDDVSMAIAIRKGVFKNIATKIAKEGIIDNFKTPVFEAFSSSVKYMIPRAAAEILSTLEALHIYENVVTYVMTTAGRIGAYEARQPDKSLLDATINNAFTLYESNICYKSYFEKIDTCPIGFCADPYDSN